MTDKPKKPGPEPDRLKLDEQDWEDAVRKALKKKPPGQQKKGKGKHPKKD